MVSSSFNMSDAQAGFLKEHGYISRPGMIVTGCDPINSRIEFINEEGEEEKRTVCDVWTRVMGYHRPVSAFNPGKKSEHAERTCYEERRLGFQM